jgi:DNA-binding transcriptional MerR regulator
MGGHMQIGEVAERTGLSLRTIRYYEEVGLVVPSARSQGGFRLYTEPDIERLALVKRMKPLGFQLEEMRELLAVLDPSATGMAPSDEQRAQLRQYCETAEQRCAELRAKLEMAEEFAAMLRKSLKRTRPADATSR